MDKKTFVYKTTNLLNGRYYIGVHTTENENDGYLGSGTAITEAVKKYGRENFAREILEYYDTPSKAYEAEESLVDVNDPLSYNMKKGGFGGWGPNATKMSHTPEVIERANKKRRVSNSIAAKKMIEEGRHNFQLHKAGDKPHVRKARSQRMKGNNYGATRKITDNSRELWSEAAKGNTNVRGRIWICNDITGERYRVSPDYHIPKGFRKGYKLNATV